MMNLRHKGRSNVPEQTIRSQSFQGKHGPTQSYLLDLFKLGLFLNHKSSYGKSLQSGSYMWIYINVVLLLGRYPTWCGTLLSSCIYGKSPTLEQRLHKLRCLQIGICDSVWVLVLYVGVCVLCVCMSCTERGIEERKKETEIGDRMGDDRLDLITGWNGWEVFVVQRFLNSTFLCASRDRIHS